MSSPPGPGRLPRPRPPDLPALGSLSALPELLQPFLLSPSFRAPPSASIALSLLSLLKANANSLSLKEEGFVEQWFQDSSLQGTVSPSAHLLSPQGGGPLGFCKRSWRDLG